MGAWYEELEICGYRPEEADLTEIQKEIIRERCKYNPIFNLDKLSNAERSYFRGYSEDAEKKIFGSHKTYVYSNI
ncbi:hypothetical protein GWK36_11570 [Caldichromatium japonicum]|uniref:Uncharacterized protein n=1 Tax=Caldichromatium japonicum TaxID=2699430 RepID=A0A6G7VF85_9GAMM|nr:hypothetical protein [Caldichromatium japonicum]QIK38518.1 hypothetical protein GWK36_11570 [Caldichromatium japonicum]